MTTVAIAPTSLPLEVSPIWAEAQKAQEKARTRKVDKADVELFVYLCSQAIKVCDRYGVDYSAIEVEVAGGAVSTSYKHAAETTILQALGRVELKNGKRALTNDIEIKAYRGKAKHTPAGYCKPHARILVPASHPARQALKDAGLIEGRDRYARVYRA